MLRKAEKIKAGLNSDTGIGISTSKDDATAVQQSTGALSSVTGGNDVVLGSHVGGTIGVSVRGEANASVRVLASESARGASAHASEDVEQEKAHNQAADGQTEDADEDATVNHGDHSAHEAHHPGRSKWGFGLGSLFGGLSPWRRKKDHNITDPDEIAESYGRSKWMYARGKWIQTLQSLQRQQKVNASRTLGAVLSDKTANVSINGTNVPRLKILKKSRPTFWLFNLPNAYRNLVRWFFGRIIKTLGYIQVFACMCPC
jgi:hypothetical protein